MIFAGGPIRGTPGGWHFNAVSNFTWPSSSSLTFARNSGLYLGKFRCGAPPAPRAPPRPAAPGGAAPSRPVAAPPGKRSAQFVTQIEPSGSFSCAPRPGPGGPHVPFRSGRPSVMRGVVDAMALSLGRPGPCAVTTCETTAEAASVAVNSKRLLVRGILITALLFDGAVPLHLSSADRNDRPGT